MLKTVLLGVLGALALGAAPRAEVVDATSDGFTVRQTVVVNVPAARAFEALMQPGEWWDSSHTFSHDARNLSVDVTRRCLCEGLPNGGWTSHLQLITYAPGERLVFEGGMGPMSASGATGHMVWSVAEADGHTTITWIYSIGGYLAGGGLQPFAPAVDGMIGQQVRRLGAYLNTGRPG